MWMIRLRGIMITKNQSISTMQGWTKGCRENRQDGQTKQKKNKKNKQKDSIIKKCYFKTNETQTGTNIVYLSLGYNPITQTYEQSDRGNKLRDYN